MLQNWRIRFQFIVVFFLSGTTCWGTSTIKGNLEIEQGPVQVVVFDSTEETQTPSIQFRLQDSEPYFFAILNGIFLQNDGGVLLFKEDKVEVAKNGRFKLEVQITSDITDFEILAIDPTGNFNSIHGIVRVPKWEAFFNGAVKRNSVQFTFDVKGTTTAIQQDQTPLFTQFGVSPKASVRVLTSHTLDVQGELRGFLSPQSADSMDRDLQVIGTELNAGYRFRHLISNSNLRFGLGYTYINRLLATSGNEDFQHLQSPQVSLKYEYPFPGHHYGWASLKYAPIGAGFGKMSPKNSLILLGVGFEILDITSENQIGVSFEISNLTLNTIAKAALLRAVSLGLYVTF